MNALKRVGALCRGTLGTRRPDEFSEPPSRLESPVVAFLFPNTAEDPSPSRATRLTSLARRLPPPPPLELPSERDDDASASASASAGPPSSDAHHAQLDRGRALDGAAASRDRRRRRPSRPTRPHAGSGWMRRLVRGGAGDSTRGSRGSRRLRPPRRTARRTRALRGRDRAPRGGCPRTSPVEDVAVLAKRLARRPLGRRRRKRRRVEACLPRHLLSSSARASAASASSPTRTPSSSPGTPARGCACVSGFMHRDCAVAFVLATSSAARRRRRSGAACLEDMVYLDELARAMAARSDARGEGRRPRSSR